jgi:hypothetical protein
MPISSETICSTAELLAVVGLSKGRLSQLEGAGIISRLERDRWNLPATVQALLRDAHERSAKHSEAKARLETLKAEREKLKLMKESKDVVPASDIETLLMFFTGKLLPFLSAFPIHVAGHDLALRRKAEKIVFDGQTQMADACRDEANRLLGKEKDGKAS